jgi:hypothetical protein
MPPYRRLGLLSAALTAVFAFFPLVVEASGPTAHVVSESASGLTLRISFPAPVTQEVELDGARYLSVAIPGVLSAGSDAPAGSPSLPNQGFPFGLPESANARIVRAVTLSTSAFDGLAPAPVPEQTIVPGDPLNSQRLRYAANPEAYASLKSFPGETVSLGPVYGFRHQRVQSLIVHPVHVVPSSGHYEAVREIEVELRFEGAPGGPSLGRRVSVRTDAPGWDETYDRVLVNPTSAREFRTRAAPVPERPQVGPGDTYIRMRLGGSGLSRVPYTDLEAEGWPAGIAPADVRVEERGYDKALANPFTVVSLPRRIEDTNQDNIFDAGDFLVFYGLNYQDRFNPPIADARYSYFHTYWVTPSDGPGTDYAVVDGFPSGAYTPVTSFLQTQHFEKNLSYINNPKDSLPYIYPVYDALYWLQLRENPNTGDHKTVDLPFSIGDLAPGGNFRVRARWQGVNTALATRTHVAALDLNSQVLLAEGQPTTFCDLEPFLWEGPFQPMAGLLNAGQNTLTVKAHNSDDPSGCAYGQSTNDFSGAMFDWFEVIYDRLLLAHQDQLAFNSGAATGDVELSVPGFTSANILVLDVTNPVAPFALTPNIVNTAGNYTATIRVTVGSTPRKFLAIVPEAVTGLPPSAYALPADLGPKTIARGLPRDLLADGEGSDYILITHPTFRQAWQPLVDHRQSEGHTVLVADVWEIYDQFAGGDKTPWAIQRFLTQAFRNWDPAPSFVCLGGDADEDYRNDTPGSSPDWVPTLVHFGAVPGTSGPELAGTDSWYVQFLRPGDTEFNDVLPEMNEARIPAGSVGEVTDFVQKILDYENMGAGDDWRRRGFFLSDDQYSSGILSGAAYCWQSGESAFKQTTIAVVDSIHVKAGLNTFRADTLFMNNYLDPVPSLNRHPGPGDCPGATAGVNTFNYTRQNITPAVLDSLSHGCLIWEFTGHANRSRITHEGLLDHSSFSLHDMDKVLNFGKPFLFMGYACHLMEFEYVGEGTSGYDNIGEALLMAPNRGAIGVFASDSYEWLPTNPYAQVYTTRPLFWNLPRDPDGRPRRLWGEAMTRGIVQLVMEHPLDFGVRDMPRTYQTFGDPALRIDIMPGTWSSVSIDGSPWTEGQSLAAASFTDTVDVTAIVADDVDISTVKAFNDSVQIPTSFVTVVPPSPTKDGVQPFQVRVRTPLYLGTYNVRVEATDWAGRPSSLILPVRFDTQFDADGSPIGNTVDPGAVIGITVTSPIPLSASAFALFVDGTPSAITATGGPTTWRVLIPGPWAQGAHTVELRVSDPNATCVPGPCPLVRSITFNSAGGGAPLALKQVYFYPNPVEAEDGAFVYELSKNGAKGQVTIYSLTGRRVRRDDSPVRAGLNSYRWDLRDEKGDRVANGVYLFVLRLEGADGEVITTASHPERVAITR